MAEPARSARPPGEVRCGRGRGGGGGSRGRGRGLVARVAAAQAASARPQPTAAAAVQAADAVPALEAAAALPVAADVQSHSDECKESPTSLAVPHGKGPACLGATDVSSAAAGQDDQFVRDEHASWGGFASSSGRGGQLGGWSRWRRRQSLTGVRPLARVRACAAAALRRSAREPPPRARPREPCASAPL